MPTVEEITRELKKVWDVSNWTFGLLDSSKTKTICVYPPRSVSNWNPQVGGNPTYRELVFPIVLRWGNALLASEKKAIELYNKLPIRYDSNFIMPQNNSPVFLDTDGKGNFEFSLNVRVLRNGDKI